MDQRLSFITIGVQDLDKMRRFYNEVFGWTPLKSDEGIVFYKMSGFILAFFPAGELAADINIKLDGTGFKQFSMAINFGSEAEVDAVYRNLINNGAGPIRPPEKVFWGGYRGYISDPENNYWELAYNPFLKTDKSSNVTGHK